MEPSGNWERQYQQDVGPKLVAVAIAAQVAASRESDSYVADVLNELAFGPRTRPGVVNPYALAGVAGDGRPVASLMQGAVVRAGKAFNRDVAPAKALGDAQRWIDMVTESLIADANRAAELVAMAPRPWVDGWVRMVNPPACARCTLLSGKFYLFNEGFLRHPNCDCFHVPAPKDPAKVRTLIDINSPDRLFESLSEGEQDRIFTKAGAEAIREGADIGQVVNARRGMRKAQQGRTDVLITIEGTTRRGLAKQTRIRLMPESIFELADGDRDEAVRLLKLYRYII